MDPIIRYDQFLHHRVCSPLAKALQRWLHLNRYHLLFGSQLLELCLHVVMGLIPFWLVWTAGSTDLSNMVLLIVGTGLLWMRFYNGILDEIRALGEMADRFEEAGFSKPPARMLLVAVRTRSMRPFSNVLSTLLIAFSVFAPVKEASVVATSLVLFAWSAVMIWTSHLWDVDNLDPRDREYLFGPKMREQETKS